MRSAFRPGGVVMGLVVLMCAGAVLAQDWPQWRGPNRDGKAVAFTAPATWPTGLTQKWKVTVGPGDSTPALVGDKLFIFTREGGDEVNLCLNAADGKEVWRDKYAATAVTGAPSRHPGPRGSPAVADGKVVTIGVAGVVSCLDAATGKLLWRKDPFPNSYPRFFAASSPIIVDGLAIAQLGGQGKGGIVAFDLAKGDEKWRWEGDAADYSSPALMTADGVKQIVALGEKSLVGLAVADGKLLWQSPCALQGRMSYNACTPILDGQTIIVSGGGRGTKAVKVEKSGDAFAAKELWSNPDVNVQFNTPVLKDGLLFGLTNKGNLFCLNAKDGKTAWTDSTGRGKGGFGSVDDAGTVLVALGSDGELVIYKPDGAAFGEIAKVKAAESATYAHPVLSGKRIFVRDQDSIILWTLD